MHECMDKRDLGNIDFVLQCKNNIQIYADVSAIQSLFGANQFALD